MRATFFDGDVDITISLSSDTCRGYGKLTNVNFCIRTPRLENENIELVTYRGVGYVINFDCFLSQKLDIDNLDKFDLTDIRCGRWHSNKVTKDFSYSSPSISSNGYKIFFEEFLKILKKSVTKEALQKAINDYVESCIAYHKNCIEKCKEEIKEHEQIIIDWELQ